MLKPTPAMSTGPSGHYSSGGRDGGTKERRLLQAEAVKTEIASGLFAHTSLQVGDVSARKQ